MRGKKSLTLLQPTYLFKTQKTITMKINYPHTLGATEALKRLQDFAEKLKQQYASEIEEASEQWNGNTGEFILKAKGIKVKGLIKVTDNNVEIESKVPLILKPFQSQIENLIKDELRKLLS